MDKSMLIKQREIVKGKIKRIQTFVQNCILDTASVKLQDIEVRARHLNNNWVELCDIQDKIEQLCDGFENDQQTLEREQAENTQFEIEAQLSDLMEHLNTSFRGESSSDATALRNPSTQVKLPRIDLPKFTGNYLDWTSYHDLFVALVHANTGLTSVQKLFYLKSSLDGEAKRLLDSFSSTNANYAEAWTVLINRYQNQRIIINAHINSLFNLKTVTSDSPESLRRLLDTTNENIRALKVLGESTDHWSSILIHLVTAKLDRESRRDWEFSLKDSLMPVFSQLQEFLEQRCRGLEAAINHKAIKVGTKVSTSKYASSYHTAMQSCEICKKDHAIYRCEQFLKASVAERIEMAKHRSLCYNCLRGGHSAVECKSSFCKRCQKRHNSLLHRENNSASATQNSKPIAAPIVPTTQISNHYCKELKQEVNVLLSTALIRIKNDKGYYQQCRALLDPGSQASFISEGCMQRLGLQRQGANVDILGLGYSRAGSSRGMVICSFTNIKQEQIYVAELLILPKLTGLLPQQTLSFSSWDHIKNLSLADPAFFRAGSIDLLFGAEICAELIMEGVIKGPKGSPMAQNTALGWVLSGGLTSYQGKEIVSCHVTYDIDKQLQQFWEIEELPKQRVLTEDEQYCETHFKDTHTRDTNGRYIVHLPFNLKIDQMLGESKSIAMRRLNYVETRLVQQPEKQSLYRSFMQEYLKMGHMTTLEHDIGDTNVTPYYIPHHAVLKESSNTTKLRVVFDASCKTSTGISLNEKLLVGPTLQDNLTAIVLRFRIYPVVFTADIAKMYRQILICEHDRAYQRIVWRNTHGQMEEYQLNTVTYGMASSPYLATKVLQQLSIDERERYPLASGILARDFYVDDLMSGAMSETEAISTQIQLIELLQSGGFELRQWMSNFRKLVEHLPPELRKSNEPLSLGFDTAIKILGLQWHPQEDCFSFKVKTDNSSALSKRSILSKTAQLFDPLGWLSPIIIRAKLLMQRLWLAGVDWDDSLPSDIEVEWTQLLNELPDITKIKIPRHLGIQSTSDQIELHGFCDSSEIAYAAVVYVRTIAPDGTITVHMLCAKTKVAPIRQISLPRLELCGAYLLARLLSSVINDLKLEFTHIYAWSDSTVVLSWLAALPNKWKTFVANRVSLIQELIPPRHWNHVSSADNPADCASRGLGIDKLLDFRLWWNGPHWLYQNSSEWKRKPIITVSETTCEERRQQKVSLTASICQGLDILQRYSSLSTLMRVTAYCNRFIYNCKAKGVNARQGPLTLIELKLAHDQWIQTVQQQEFLHEVTLLQSDKPLKSTSHILSLCPFLDMNGILRVGGRLKFANITYDQRHPILLPQRCHLTTLIIAYEHLRSLHAGPQLLLAILRLKYWIPNGRNVVRQFVQKCVICHRHRVKTTQQFMGELPTCRVQPGRPFDRVGVDYGGPFTIRMVRGRGAGSQKMYKSYIALFVCMATKAIHLELVLSLTSEAFLAALQRFVSRRGKPHDVFSDCGTNFKGANSELQTFVKLMKSDSKINNKLLSEAITWHFIPPGSPHFGGLWEAGIKSVKTHLARVVGTNILTFEELYTLLTQVEAYLNSRPLCALSADPNDCEALTPGHFLIGQPLSRLPEPDLISTPMNRLTHWQLIKQMQQHFWKRWSIEYLGRLQQRPKWTKVHENIKVGKLVLLKDKNLPPIKWRLARVSAVHPGTDNIVRVVTLRTSDGIFKRAITNVCPLPFED